MNSSIYKSKITLFFISLALFLKNSLYALRESRKFISNQFYTQCQLGSVKNRYYKLYVFIKQIVPTIFYIGWPRQGDILSFKVWCSQANQPFLLREGCLIKIADTQVIGGDDFIVLQNNHILSDNYLTNSHLKIYNGRGFIVNTLRSELKISRAVHLCNLDSNDYMSWLIKVMPRLRIVDQIPEFNSLPLLIDADLNSQQMEVLKLFNVNQRKLIFLKRSMFYVVDELIYPFRYLNQKDEVVSQAELEYLRASIASIPFSISEGFYKNLYVFPIEKHHQSLINNSEIETYVNKGFYIIYPELLSFANQVKMFSKAEFIVGYPDSSMVNIIFASPGTKVLLSNLPYSDTYNDIFKILAAMLQIDLSFDRSGDVKKENLEKSKRISIPKPVIKSKDFPSFPVEVHSIEEWCYKNNFPCHSISDVPAKVLVKSPKIFENTKPVKLLPEGEALLPQPYLAKIRNAKVVGGADFIIVADDQLLYDELALSKNKNYRLRTPFLERKDGSIFQLNGVIKDKRKFKQAVHFCKDASYNYFHWLIEALPRLYILNQFPEFVSVPLLVDGELPYQYLEALKLLNNFQRELIFLTSGTMYDVDELIYPSDLSITHNNDNLPLPSVDDTVISPASIHFLRSEILKKLTYTPEKFYKKIYISRKGTKFQRLINSDEVEAFFIKKGFYIIYPERLSFSNQVKIFLQAEIIVGVGGAGMTNMIFSQPGTKILTLSPKHTSANYYIYSMLADILQITLYFLLGTYIIDGHDHKDHNPFFVDITALEQMVSRIEVEEKCYG